MNITDLSAAFAEHEADAPDVTETRLGIEAQLAGGARHWPLVGGAVAASAAVVVIAVTPGILRSPNQTGAVRPRQAQSTRQVPVHPGTTRAARHRQDGTFPFRPGELPAAATLNHSEVGDQGPYFLEDFTFGSVPSQQRGLTLWFTDGPLPTRLRDGGVLVPTTVQGHPAVEGWSPSSRSYTVSVQRPHGYVMTTLAYGWDRATTASYAGQTARRVQYGSFPAPH